MKEINILAGTPIEKACAELFDRALHGEFVYTDFNGVRISMCLKNRTLLDGESGSLLQGEILNKILIGKTVQKSGLKETGQVVIAAKELYAALVNEIKVDIEIRITEHEEK